MLRWSDDQLREYHSKRQGRAEARQHQKEVKRPKYKNKKVEIDGRIFASQIEGERYIELKRLQKAGAICNMRCQVKFELAPGVKIAGASRKSPPLRYFADFVYTRDGEEVIEDVKGSKEVTEGYRIKRHLMALKGRSIIEIRNRNHARSPR